MEQVSPTITPPHQGAHQSPPTAVPLSRLPLPTGVMGREGAERAVEGSEGMVEGSVLSVHWEDHGHAFFSMLTTLRRKEVFCDVTLACEGMLYPAHRLVLSTCSDFFHHILSVAPSSHPVVVMASIRARDLEALLNYMYMGEARVMEDDLGSFLTAAEALRIKGLVQHPPRLSTGGQGKRTLPRKDVSPAKHIKVEGSPAAPPEGDAATCTEEAVPHGPLLPPLTPIYTTMSHPQQVSPEVEAEDILIKEEEPVMWELDVGGPVEEAEVEEEAVHSHLSPGTERDLLAETDDGKEGEMSLKISQVSSVSPSSQSSHLPTSPPSPLRPQQTLPDTPTLIDVATEDGKEEDERKLRRRVTHTGALNWRLCLFCQRTKKTKPLYQAKEQGRETVRNAAKTRRKLHDTKNSRVIDLVERTLADQAFEKVVWHRTCYNIFTNKFALRRLATLAGTGV